ncbi:MAG: hypothetical protein PUF41_02795 [Prevotella copri]|nr:hypothetical protein [uncultured Prevotella sp.]MDD6528923.1 hypothetical protein [Segatella copri]
MKRTYIAPMAETIKLNLSSSVLQEGVGMGGDSTGTSGDQAQAKQFNTWSFGDEEEEEKQSNIWE